MKMGLSLGLTEPRGGASAPAFDPTTLSPTGWWRASFSASPWVGEAGGNMTEATNPPTAGTAVNGLTPAQFNGSTRLITTANDFSTYISNGAGSVLCVFYADAASVAAALKYNDPPLVCDQNNSFNLGFSDGGIGVAFYDGAWQQPARIACATGGWHLAKVTWNGTTLSYGLDGGAMSTAAAGNYVTNVGSKLRLGQVAVSATAYFNGRILEVLTKNTALSGTDIDNYRSYISSRYGVSV